MPAGEEAADRPAGRLRLLPDPAGLRPDALRTRLAAETSEIRETTGLGPSGNARLTAITGVVLLVLFAVEGVTLVSFRPLLPVHVFVGMLLVPVVGLKLASTGYRFARYYAGGAAYRAAGAPQAVLRLLGPFVIAATLALFGSGVALLAVGPGVGWVVALHKGSFVAWVVVVAVHVLGHVLELPGLASADLQSDRTRRRMGVVRQAVVAAALVVGLVLAVVTAQYVAPWQAVVG